MEHDDVIVESPEVSENLAKLVDLPVVLRNEVQQIRIKADPGGASQTDDGGHHSAYGDEFAVPETEVGEGIEYAIRHAIR
jgi:hypothetical protein